MGSKMSSFEVYGPEFDTHVTAVTVKMRDFSIAPAVPSRGPEVLPRTSTSGDPGLASCACGSVCPVLELLLRGVTKCVLLVSVPLGSRSASDVPELSCVSVVWFAPLTDGLFGPPDASIHSHVAEDSVRPQGGFLCLLLGSSSAFL